MQISSGTIIQSKSILTWINFQLSDKPHSTWTYQPLRSMRAFFRRNINWTNTSYHHTESAEPLKPNRYQEPPKNIIPTRSTAERNCWTNIKDFLGGLCNKYTISRLVTDKSNNCICLNKRLTARNVRNILIKIDLFSMFELEQWKGQTWAPFGKTRWPTTWTTRIMIDLF